MPIPQQRTSLRLRSGLVPPPDLSEFILPYEAAPDATLLDFLQSTYEAAATTGKWDRAALECPIGIPGVPREVA